jgi:hypothetical protein
MWTLKGVSIGLAMIILEFLIFIIVKFGYLMTTGKQTYMTAVLPIHEYWFWIAFVTIVAFVSWFLKIRASG